MHKSLSLIVLLSVVCFANFVSVSPYLKESIFSGTDNNYYDLHDLDHGKYYLWGIDYHLPTNHIITNATISIDNITNNDNQNNALFIHLFDNVNKGVRESTDPYPFIKDFFGTGGILLTFKDENGSRKTQDLNYSFSDSQLLTLTKYITNNNNFGFGFDPDCHFFNDGVRFSFETKAVPEPALLSLFGIGLVSLGFISRKRKK